MNTRLPRYKPPLRRFLAQNPMPHPLETGLFYREKMRAIYRLAPDEPFAEILEVGGGQSGLTALLYPKAHVINLDMDLSFWAASCNRRPEVSFINGSAERLPFKDHVFDAVTLLDVLEHVPDDKEAVREVLRVLRSEGTLLVSAPNQRWRFPCHGLMKGICPPARTVMKSWGHVRAGYSRQEIAALTGRPVRDYRSYINPLTAPAHDLGFSRLPPGRQRLVCLLLSPLTFLGYLLPGRSLCGLETVMLL